MEFKYNEGDRIRLTEDIGQELPFLQTGALGMIQQRAQFSDRESGPSYFVQMDAIDPYNDPEELDFWFVHESRLESAE